VLLLALISIDFTHLCHHRFFFATNGSVLTRCANSSFVQALVQIVTPSWGFILPTIMNMLSALLLESGRRA
jgi:hypothetical protein